MSITLIAADSHPIFLLGLQQLLSAEADLQLVATCATADKALFEVRRLKPQVLLIDIDLSDRSGLDVVRELRNEDQDLKVVILTAVLDDEKTIEALRLDIQGVLLKEMPAHLLLQCLRKVAAGGQWLEKNSLGHAFEQLLLREAGARRLATILTERETEVMSLVAKGLTNREIAEKLVLSQGTVKIHVHNIYGKLGINNRVDLTLYAQKKGVA
jgi:DNA-binding NarL/FixJ family response regulator